MNTMKDMPEINWSLEDFLMPLLYPLENFTRLLDNSADDENIRLACILWPLIHELKYRITELCARLKKELGNIKIISQYNPETGRPDLKGVIFNRALKQSRTQAESEQGGSR